MSFLINHSLAAAAPLINIQERDAHPQNRRAPGRAVTPARKEPDFDDLEDLILKGRCAADIRCARDFEADLSASISFLHTQKAALQELENLIVHESTTRGTVLPFDSLPSRDRFEAIRNETFNGSRLFARGVEGRPLACLRAEEPTWDATPENLMGNATAQPGYFLRPAAGAVDVSIPTDREKLMQEIARARLENLEEQKRMQALQDTSRNTIGAPPLHPGGLQMPDLANASTAISKNRTFRDTHTALSAQANTAHEAVLRLFE
jgi:hypothetical protein